MTQNSAHERQGVKRSVNRKDFLAGLVFIGIGAFYLAYTMTTLPIGRPMAMGPGFFPVVLSLGMVLVGAAIVLRSRTPGDGTKMTIASARTIFFVTLSIVLFAALLEKLGLFPTLVLSVVLSCLSAPQWHWVRITLVSLTIALFCTFVFRAGLKLPVPVFGPWFGG